MRATIFFLVGACTAAVLAASGVLAFFTMFSCTGSVRKVSCFCIGMHLVTLTLHSLASCSGHNNLCSYECSGHLKPSQPSKGSRGSPLQHEIVKGKRTPRFFVGGGGAAVLVLMSFLVLLSSSPASAPWDFAACGTAHSLKCTAQRHQANSACAWTH